MCTGLDRFVRTRQTGRRAWGTMVLAALFVAAAAGCAAMATPVGSIPAPRATETPMGSAPLVLSATMVSQVTVPVPSSTPRPTLPPSPTAPPPTLDRTAVAATITAGAERVGEVGADVLCLRWEDVNGDTVAEWVGAYAVSSGVSRLGGFVLDGEAWYELAAVPQSRYGLGEHPICRLDVRDINLDGRKEILVWGRAASNVDLLHVFTWVDAEYMLLASFEGNAGIRIEERDGQLGEEVVVGHRVGDDLVWEVVYAWDGLAYGWTWDRHAWFYTARPHVYDTTSPVLTVASFYLALNDRDLPGAFGLLAVTADSPDSYEDWALGFATTIGIEASAVREVRENTDGTRLVTAQVLAYDNRDGRVVATWWDVAWAVVRSADGWRLRPVSSDLLASRELPYFR